MAGKNSQHLKCTSGEDDWKVAEFLGSMKRPKLPKPEIVAFVAGDEQGMISYRAVTTTGATLPAQSEVRLCQKARTLGTLLWNEGGKGYYLCSPMPISQLQCPYTKHSSNGYLQFLP